MGWHLALGGVSVSVAGIVVLGIVVGFVAGMFGVGGGFLLTPMLTIVFGVPMPIAIGTGLCQIVGSSVATLLRHRRMGQGEIRFDIVMLVGSVVGVDAGARSLSALERLGTVTFAGRSIAAVNLVAEGAYGVMLLSVAALFWRQGGTRTDALEHVRVGPLARVRLGPPIDLPAVPLRRVSAIVIAECGLALGFVSGLLGIGGGVALMPVLIYGFGFPIRQAAGTGVLVLVVTSSVGTLEHAIRGHVHLGLAMLLMVGSTISAQFGALATRKLSARTLRRAFAAVVMLTFIAVAWDLGRRWMPR